MVRRVVVGVCGLVLEGVTHDGWEEQRIRDMSHAQVENKVWPSPQKEEDTKNEPRKFCKDELNSKPYYIISKLLGEYSTYQE
ncbi:unnamed protein product [Sphenostylis stenocarpa]|uniref:Uncharacterized protein n=1 Tax=Sphenostylis stenocarpa TaxID=92480 RepID=A0AA86SZ50_9FABA|nr:unnamed protein product [Sphenostylis stenocarpa]